MGVPVVTLSDDYACPFSLHDHGVEEVLEGLLSGYEFFHDNLVNLVNPVGDLSLFVLLGSKDGVDCLVDDFLKLL